MEEMWENNAVFPGACTCAYVQGWGIAELISIVDWDCLCWSCFQRYLSWQFTFAKRVIVSAPCNYCYAMCRTNTSSMYFDLVMWCLRSQTGKKNAEYLKSLSLKTSSYASRSRANSSRDHSDDDTPSSNLPSSTPTGLLDNAQPSSPAVRSRLSVVSTNRDLWVQINVLNAKLVVIGCCNFPGAAKVPEFVVWGYRSLCWVGYYQQKKRITVVIVAGRSALGNDRAGFVCVQFCSNSVYRQHLQYLNLKWFSFMCKH